MGFFQQLLGIPEGELLHGFSMGQPAIRGMLCQLDLEFLCFCEEIGHFFMDGLIFPLEHKTDFFFKSGDENNLCNPCFFF